MAAAELLQQATVLAEGVYPRTSSVLVSLRDALARLRADNGNVTFIFSTVVNGFAFCESERNFLLIEE